MKKRGRPPIPDEQKAVTRSVTLPRQQWEEIDAARGRRRPGEFFYYLFTFFTSRGGK